MRLSVCLRHISMTFEPTRVHYISRHGTCCRPCATKCERCEKDGEVYVEKVQGCDCGFDLHQTQGCGQFSRRPCTFFALLAAAPLYHTHHSRRGLHRVAAAFTLSVFASVFMPVS